MLFSTEFSGYFHNTVGFVSFKLSLLLPCRSNVGLAMLICGSEILPVASLHVNLFEGRRRARNS